VFGNDTFCFCTLSLQQFQGETKSTKEVEILLLAYV
jgi:hypothetical protein